MLPVYLPFILVWITVKLFCQQIRFSQIVDNLFGIQGFSSVGGDFNWYLTGIIICYLLTPYLVSFIQRNKLGKNVILIGFLLLISTVFWEDGRMIISITRLPVYALGMIFARYDEKILSRKLLYCEAIGFVLGSVWLWLSFKYVDDYLWDYGFYWYPFVLMTPFICHAVSLFSILSTKSKIGKKIVCLISVVGNYSFEIYLAHTFMIHYRNGEFSQNTTVYKSFFWPFEFLFVISFVILLRFISKIIRRICRI